MKNFSVHPIGPFPPNPSVAPQISFIYPLSPFIFRLPPPHWSSPPLLLLRRNLPVRALLRPLSARYDRLKLPPIIPSLSFPQETNGFCDDPQVFFFFPLTLTANFAFFFIPFQVRRFNSSLSVRTFMALPPNKTSPQRVSCVLSLFPQVTTPNRSACFSCLNFFSFVEFFRPFHSLLTSSLFDKLLFFFLPCVFRLRRLPPL